MRAWTVVMLAFAVLAGQSATGSIAGALTDSDGGAIPGAVVSATAGRATFKATTNSVGRYRIEGVPPGRYTVRAKLRGFVTKTAEDIVVEAGRDTTWNASLRVGMGPPREAPVARDPLDPVVARGIYAAVFRVIFKSTVPARLIVHPDSLVPPLIDLEDWNEHFSRAPASLRTGVLASDSQRPVWLNPESFPAGTSFVTRQEIGALYRGNSLEFRDALRARWGTTSTSSFTRAFVSDDGRDAFVYFEHSCGGLCGEGTAVWVRWTPVGVWLVMETQGFWVS
jgi:hypothetical protein